MRNFLARAALLGAMVGSFYIGYLADCPPAPDASVSTFNVGFADSKQDDCYQGFQPACDWVSVH
ncbi:hypothetical protein [Kitasatospora sp. NPDC001095]